MIIEKLNYIEQIVAKLNIKYKQNELSVISPSSTSTYTHATILGATYIILLTYTCIYGLYIQPRSISKQSFTLNTVRDSWLLPVLAGLLLLGGSVSTAGCFERGRIRLLQVLLVQESVRVHEILDEEQSQLSAERRDALISDTDMRL